MHNFKRLTAAEFDWHLAMKAIDPWWPAGRGLLVWPWWPTVDMDFSPYQPTVGRSIVADKLKRACQPADMADRVDRANVGLEFTVKQNSLQAVIELV